ncbi:acyltransferase family protein [Hypericibacter sp.]|uniref:acyltransferase family protein n=1 Tax=Hypericibacter sp. TaxID=2705401 RepID=UPI003D6D03CE
MIAPSTPSLGPQTRPEIDAPAELRALTGLRAFAALAVLLYHFREYVPPILGPHAVPVHLLFSAGYLGVDLFFLLSGFIIAYRYGATVRGFAGRAYWSYLWARLVRLYPVHLVTLTAMLLLVGLAQAFGLPIANPHYYETDDFFKQLLLIAGWAVPISRSWNVPAWSISCEWAAYLVFPALHALTGRLPLRWRSLALLLVAHGLLLSWFALEHPYQGNLAYGLLRLTGCFAIGCFLQRLHARKLGQGAPWPSIAATALLVLPGFATLVDFIGGQSFAVAPILLSVVIYGLAMDESRGLGRWLARPVAVYWGQVSYSVYMGHWIVVAAGWTLIEVLDLEPMAPWIATLAMLLQMGLILLFAVLLYHKIELPCRQRMRRWYAEIPADSRALAVKTAE